MSETIIVEAGTEAGTDAVIRASWFPSKNTAKSLLIIAHGYKGFKDWGMFPYIAEALSMDNHVVTFNFSHNGIGEDLENFTELEKFARNTYSREQEDLELLLSNLRARHEFRELPLFLLGHSRGAGSCFVYALDHPGEIAGVISWNGVTDLDLFTLPQKEEMRAKGRSYVENARTGQQLPLDAIILEDLEQNRQRFAIVDRLANSQLPAVLIQGTEDSKRLREGSALLTSVRPDIEWVQIQGGNHTFNTVHPFQGGSLPLDQAITETRRFIEWIAN
ncbi:alpha/beta hydrolase family protein [Paenibacillus sp. SEL3]|uniref:Alpha/beta hydrolase n=1 Tax=Paenibacillus polymyxa TaxID=1406 RepID=A0A8I1IUI1_PAEPO|nr:MULTISPECIES: alpha/beta hydrolase [Paenibacillus]KAF6573929.1 alpha/beta hydrolase [Paenibacillus sp. EKM206P]KAF6588186.1 alpha/beta hydrolase [Paenibacillus sp. EKM205P]MBM0635746.1 alpha/beta hydrolase [Paenibacillus polymyxa]MBO3282856.1 alpha/beta hydrolase [Paenibacillus polymyxa]MBP1309659.1 pimeloyl-ACP methyl ester carboxylesterase [Paenibacillus sp. 1182]